ncbi:hypothetical protein GGD46_004376 [Rhizobium lusitanum]|uniref:Uncharacterized protein n=1 Tax=Rhizobium lusitanum TaxID=293958 RepID=A0A7X0ITU5_9HYPH|nr:hypothetical protein [Rhizobium lusitanum]
MDHCQVRLTLRYELSQQPAKSAISGQMSGREVLQNIGDLLARPALSRVRSASPDFMLRVSLMSIDNH